MWRGALSKEWVDPGGSNEGDGPSRPRVGMTRRAKAREKGGKSEGGSEGGEKSGDGVEKGRDGEDLSLTAAGTTPSVTNWAGCAGIVEGSQTMSHSDGWHRGKIPTRWW